MSTTYVFEGLNNLAVQSTALGAVIVALIALYNLWRSRVRLRLEITSHVTDLKDCGEPPVGVKLVFKCINIGNEKTSLQRYIQVHACTSLASRMYVTYTLKLEGDLSLLSHESKTFTALGDVDVDYLGALHKAYVVRPAHGAATTFNTVGSKHTIKRNKLVRDWFCFRYRYFGKTIVN